MKKHNSVLQCQTKEFVLLSIKFKLYSKQSDLKQPNCYFSFLYSNDYYRNDYRSLWHVQWGENRSYWSYKQEFWYFKKISLHITDFALPNFTLQFGFQQDASMKAIGGACLQMHDILRPVMFSGRKLTSVERRFSTTEREFLSIVYAYKICFHLVYGRKIIYLLWYPLHSGSPKFVGSFYVIDRECTHGVYDDQGRMLNVMTTPWGLYGWNCLNMGISTASEIFRRNLESVLNGIPNRIRRRQTKQKTSMKPQSNSV
jgi:hypothetical protein